MKNLANLESLKAREKQMKAMREEGEKKKEEKNMRRALMLKEYFTARLKIIAKQQSQAIGKRVFQQRMRLRRASDSLVKIEDVASETELVDRRRVQSRYRRPRLFINDFKG